MMSFLEKGLVRAARAIDRMKDASIERYKLSRCTAGDDVHLYPCSRIEYSNADKAAVVIGAHCHILGRLAVFGAESRLTLGESCFVGEGSNIWSAASISIGDRVLISHGVNIHDFNSHSLSAAKRHEHFNQIFSTGHPLILDDVPSAPIVIEDDAWIGFNSTVLKGVTIGRGAVVGAGSVVTKDVEEYAIVVGNPARMIGQAKP